MLAATVRRVELDIFRLQIKPTLPFQRKTVTRGVSKVAESVSCIKPKPEPPKKKANPSYLKWAAGTILGGFIAYDYVENDLTYFGATGRFLRSLKVAVQISADYLILRQKEKFSNYDKLLSEVHLKSANRLLEACLQNGGLYIKIGQGVSAINHILPKEYTRTLAKLEDECLPTTKASVQKVFLKDFGALPEDLYDKFDYEPIAAASLAQVFHAKLKTGEEVAVKVQYEDLQKRFPSDLGTILFLQDIVEIFFKSYNFGWILHDLRRNLVQELNFVEEAKNTERCAKDMSKFKYVYVPKVYWERTKERVLTLEWIDAVKISDLDGIKEAKLSLKDVDLKLFTVFAEQIFNTGFVHADPHPGNIFVRKNKKNKAELVILDHGLYESVPEEVRHPLCEFWEATVLRDEEQMEKSAAELNIKGYKDFAQILFQVPFEITAGKVKSRLSDEDVAYMQEQGKHNFNKIMNTLRAMPSNLIFVVRNLNTIRAISRQHGDVVDRPMTMARHAQKCLYTNCNSIVGWVKWFCRRIRFEYCILKSSFKTSLISGYLNTLYMLGRSPVKSTDIFNQDFEDA